MTDGTKGLLFGLAATLIGGIYTVFAQQAPAMGIDPFDLLAFRFSIAGLVLFPVFVKYGLRQNFAGLGLAKALVLCVFGGVGFVFFFFSGFQYAPLSHGAVIPAGMSAIFGAILARLFCAEAFGLLRISALFLIFSGLWLVSGSDVMALGAGAWRGDMLFVIAGLNWAIFLLILAKWQVPALPATGMISVLTAAIFLPFYFLVDGYENLVEVPMHDIGLQILVQGLLAGVGALYLFARAASYLPTAVSAALPGLVPVQALVFGALFFGLYPSVVVMVGAALVIMGQLLGSGVLPIQRTR